MERKRQYNVRTSEKDERDYKIVFAASSTTTLKSVDLRSKLPPAFDQGQLGSCTAQVACAAHQYCLNLQTPKSAFASSRLFVWYNARARSGTTNQDAGCTIRDVISTLVKEGACPETLWPYDSRKFTLKPPVGCYLTAAKYKADRYVSVSQTKAQLITALQNGFPIIFGMLIYESFESDVVYQTGVVPIPNPDQEEMLGGHAMLIVGVDINKEVFIVRNSWGVGWGDNGHAYIPFSVILNSNLAFDFYTITRLRITASSIKMKPTAQRTVSLTPRTRIPRKPCDSLFTGYVVDIPPST